MTVCCVVEGGLLMQSPYLIPKSDYLTELEVIYAHAAVLHNGIRETLNLSGRSIG